MVENELSEFDLLTEPFAGQDFQPHLGDVVDWLRQLVAVRGPLVGEFLVYLDICHLVAI